MSEHPTENINYLRDNGFMTYGVLTPVDPQSICWVCINVITPLDDHETCSVRIDINFIDEYKAGKSGDTFPVEILMGIKEMKAFQAFPELFKVFTDFKGIHISVEGLCKELDKAGIKQTCHSGTTYCDNRGFLDEELFRTTG